MCVITLLTRCQCVEDPPRKRTKSLTPPISGSTDQPRPLIQLKQAKSANVRSQICIHRL
ncbi:hypothetical protein DPMN_041695 [Dreissena polymorpha]|uniref:Uncharacterized protein n=1 Tax=Dreissena polymorpha TaxID=45954 RepID=A0A9D4HWA6_DREPO|nr:hypothetical protein DPMN_041695 [Dreissena polymorpha]